MVVEPIEIIILHYYLLFGMLTIIPTKNFNMY